MVVVLHWELIWFEPMVFFELCDDHIKALWLLICSFQKISHPVGHARFIAPENLTPKHRSYLSRPEI